MDNGLSGCRHKGIITYRLAAVNRKILETSCKKEVSIQHERLPLALLGFLAVMKVVLMNTNQMSLE